MAKAPCEHSADPHYGRFVGRIGGLAVALGIGVAIANNPATASAEDGVSAEKPAATSEAPGPGPSTKGANDPVKSIVKQLNSRINEVREKVESARDESRASIREARRTTRLTNKPDQATNALVTQTIKSAPRPPKRAPNPALVAVAGFVRREMEQAITPARTHEAFTPAPAVAQSVTMQAVSPLGTPEQRDAEQTATRTANTLPVALTKLILKTGWYVTALGEYSKVGGPDKANLEQLSRSVDEYAMGAAFQQQLLNPMTPRAVMQVAPPHTWYGQTVPGSRILYDNPDTVYRFMPVNKTSTYVIRGKFENWDPQTGFDGNPTLPADTTFSLLTGISGNTAGVIQQRDLKVNDDGTFEIYVSGGPPPEGYDGNYLQLTSDSTLIAARDTLADWNQEEPMSLTIERISGPPNSFLAQLGIFAIPLIGPAVTDSPFLTQLVSIIPPLPELPIVRGAVTSVIMLVGLQMEREYIRVATVDADGEKREPNVFTDPTSNAAFLSTQLQSAGYFQLADDEALIITIDRKDAGYFNVPVTNDWTITDNYWDEPTSLNSAQAVPDEPGGTKYTFVVSKSDPNVKNWVSTGGLNQGTISIRFQDLGEGSPTVSSKVVKISELDDDGVLPPDAFIPEGDPYRQNQIADRQAGFNNRFAPFIQT